MKRSGIPAGRAGHDRLRPAPPPAIHRGDPRGDGHRFHPVAPAARRRRTGDSGAAGHRSADRRVQRRRTATTGRCSCSTSGSWASGPPGNFGFSVQAQPVRQLACWPNGMPKTVILGVLSLALTRGRGCAAWAFTRRCAATSPSTTSPPGCRSSSTRPRRSSSALIMIEIFSQHLGWFPPEAPQADGVGAHLCPVQRDGVCPLSPSRC